MGLNFCFLVVRVTVGADVNGWRIGKEGNVVLNCAGWGKLLRSGKYGGVAGEDGGYGRRDGGGEWGRW